MLLTPSVIDCYHWPSFGKKETFVTVFQNERNIFCHYLSHTKEITTPLYCHPVAIPVRFFVSRPEWGSRELPTWQKEELVPIKFAEAHGNRAAQREFGINKSNFRDWHKKKDRLEKLLKSKMADRGTKAHHSALEDELMSFVLDRRRHAVSVLTQAVHKESKKIAKRLKITTFDGSVNWVYASFVVTVCLFIAVPTSRRNYRGTTKISCSTFSASSFDRERTLTTTYHISAMLTRHHWSLTCHTTLLH